MDNVHQAPIAIYNNSDPSNIQFGVLDYSMATQTLQQTVYSPYSLGPTLAQVVIEMEQGNGTTAFQLNPGNGANNGQVDLFSCDSGFPTPFSSGGFEILASIACGDVVDPTPSGLQSTSEVYQEMASASPFFGPIFYAESEGLCAYVMELMETFSILTLSEVRGLSAQTIRSSTLSSKTQASR